MGVCESTLATLGGNSSSHESQQLDEEALHNQAYAIKAKLPWEQDCIGGNDPQTPPKHGVQPSIDMSSIPEDEVSPEGAQDLANARRLATSEESTESGGTLAEADREKV